MSLKDIFVILGLLLIVAIVVKGFWGGRRVKPIDQPDNWTESGGGSSPD